MRIEQRLRTDRVKSRCAQQRIDLSRHRRRAQSADQLLLSERALGEERLHQLFVGLGDHLDQLFARLLCAIGERSRDLPFAHLAVAAEGERLHAHEIDDAVERFFLAERQLNRDDLAGEVATQCLERSVEAGALTFQLVDDDETRQPEARGLGPHLLGLDFDAGDGIDDEDRGLGDTQRGARVTQEVGEPGCIDDVDFGLLPFRVGEAGRQGVLAGDFFFIEVGDGGAVIDLAQPVHRACHEQHRRHQLSLSASAVSDDGHITDGRGVVDLHRGNPPASPPARDPANRSGIVARSRRNASPGREPDS
jgi:hypothetical protein